MTSHADPTTGGESPLAWLDGFDEYEQLCRVRLEHLVPVREPLVVVSEISRSGGTLLSQLLDGHPELHAHPSELKIGHPKFWRWPPLDPDRPESWFETLYEKKSVTAFIRGYSKSPKKHHADYDVLPFCFLPRLQRRIFAECVAAWSPRTDREILDCYFTSYFNAWVDNQNLFATPKRAVSGFWPRFLVEPEGPERFFAAYPEGRIVSVVRDPRAWYRSMTRWLRKYEGQVDLALGRWRESTEAALAAKERYGDRVLVLTYEDIVADTGAATTWLAERLGLSYSPTLLEPTFNGRPIRANSSDPVARYGVLDDRAAAWRGELDDATVAHIEELAGDLYERAAALGPGTNATRAS